MYLQHSLLGRPKHIINTCLMEKYARGIYSFPHTITCLAGESRYPRPYDMRGIGELARLV